MRMTQLIFQACIISVKDNEFIYSYFLFLLKGVMFIPLNAIKLAAIRNLAEKKILLCFILKSRCNTFKSWYYSNPSRPLR